MKRIFSLLVFLSLTIPFWAQVKPLDSLYQYSWVSFDVRTTESQEPIYVDCNCLVRQVEGKLQVLTNSNSIVFKQGNNTLASFTVTSNPHFHNEMLHAADVQVLSTKIGALNKDQFLTFKNVRTINLLNKPIPAFSSKEGTFSIDSLNGAISVLNFWYAGCLPCRKEVPELNNLKSQFSAFGNLQFMAFSVDKELHAHEQYHFKHYLVDRKEVNEKLGFVGHPTTFVVDEKGVVVYIQSGYYENSVKDLKMFLSQMVLN